MPLLPKPTENIQNILGEYLKHIPTGFENLFELIQNYLDKRIPREQLEYSAAAYIMKDPLCRRDYYPAAVDIPNKPYRRSGRNTEDGISQIEAEWGRRIDQLWQNAVAKHSYLCYIRDVCIPKSQTDENVNEVLHDTIRHLSQYIKAVEEKREF